MSLVLRLLLVLLVARAVYRLIAGILQGYNQGAPAIPPATKLVRDPVCGIFVSPSHALTVQANGELKYFCSENCRDQWAARAVRP